MTTPTINWMVKEYGSLQELFNKLLTYDSNKDIYVYHMPNQLQPHNVMVYVLTYAVGSIREYLVSTQTWNIPGSTLRNNGYFVPDTEACRMLSVSDWQSIINKGKRQLPSDEVLYWNNLLNNSRRRPSSV